MKKALAVLCAALLIVGIAACNNNTTGNTGPSQPSLEERNALTQVVFTVPDDYELDAESPNSSVYSVKDEAGNITREIGFAYVAASQEEIDGISSKDMTQLEDGMSVYFDDNIKVSFIDVGENPGIQLDTLNENGELAEVCYYVILDSWLVMMVNGGDLEYLDEMQADMKAILDTLSVEELTFG